MTRFDLQETPIAGVLVVTPRRLVDGRGQFARLFCAEDLKGAGWSKSVAQINQSITRHAGTARGFHFQRPPHAEMKLITCVSGSAWDVAVDLREGSATWLRWFAVELSEDNGKQILIPEGCAHGFQALRDHTQLVYLHSAPYHPETEGGISLLDPDLGVTWPLPVQGLSPRDSALPNLGASFAGLSP